MYSIIKTKHNITMPFVQILFSVSDRYFEVFLQSFPCFSKKKTGMLFLYNHDNTM